MLNRYKYCYACSLWYEEIDVLIVGDITKLEGNYQKLVMGHSNMALKTELICFVSQNIGNGDVGFHSC